MKLFGGILPFIGWRVVELEPDDGLPDFSAMTWEADALEMEWLGAGVTLRIGEVRARVK